MLYVPGENVKIYKSHEDKCTGVRFGRVCGTLLGFERQLSFEKNKWTPFKAFQFIPLSTWLKKMFASAEFHKPLNSTSFYDQELIADVSQGRIWKEFTAKCFFCSNYNVDLMLNVDWFTPLKRSEYKVGAIMLTVLNLPREERYKKKWTIIAGNVIASHKFPPFSFSPLTRLD